MLAKLKVLTKRRRVHDVKKQLQKPLEYTVGDTQESHNNVNIRHTKDTLSSLIRKSQAKQMLNKRPTYAHKNEIRSLEKKHEKTVDKA